MSKCLQCNTSIYPTDTFCSIVCASAYLTETPPIDSITEVDSSEETSANNGGNTDYYRIKDAWEFAQDVIEDRNMNFSQGNIFKAAFTFNVGRHEASSYERELNKIIWFANRELNRIKG